MVCRRLWDELPPDARTIGVENLLASGDVDAALAAYYDGSVAELAAADVPAERALREWFGDRLITPGGIRGQVLREQTATGGLDNDAVDSLVATHLVRAEQRDAKTWLELAHDRLVVPVLDSNTAWFDGAPASDAAAGGAVGAGGKAGEPAACAIRSWRTPRAGPGTTRHSCVQSRRIC